MPNFSENEIAIIRGYSDVIAPLFASECAKTSEETVRSLQAIKDKDPAGGRPVDGLSDEEIQLLIAKKLEDIVSISIDDSRHKNKLVLKFNDEQELALSERSGTSGEIRGAKISSLLLGKKNTDPEQSILDAIAMYANAPENNEMIIYAVTPALNEINEERSLADKVTHPEIIAEVLKMVAQTNEMRMEGASEHSAASSGEGGDPAGWDDSYGDTEYNAHSYSLEDRKNNKGPGDDSTTKIENGNRHVIGAATNNLLIDGQCTDYENLKGKSGLSEADRIDVIRSHGIANLEAAVAKSYDSGEKLQTTLSEKEVQAAQCFTVVQKEATNVPVFMLAADDKSTANATDAKRLEFVAKQFDTCYEVYKRDCEQNGKTPVAKDDCAATIVVGTKTIFGGNHFTCMMKPPGRDWETNDPTGLGGPQRFNRQQCGGYSAMIEAEAVSHYAGKTIDDARGEAKESGPVNAIKRACSRFLMRVEVWLKQFGINKVDYAMMADKNQATINEALGVKPLGSEDVVKKRVAPNK